MSADTDYIWPEPILLLPPVDPALLQHFREQAAKAKNARARAHPRVRGRYYNDSETTNDDEASSSPPPSSSSLPKIGLLSPPPSPSPSPSQASAPAYQHPPHSHPRTTQTQTTPTFFNLPTTKPTIHDMRHLLASRRKTRSSHPGMFLALDNKGKTAVIRDSHSIS